MCSAALLPKNNALKNRQKKLLRAMTSQYLYDTMEKLPEFIGGLRQRKGNKVFRQA
jgi:hypothetical protein